MKLRYIISHLPPIILYRIHSDDKLLQQNKRGNENNRVKNENDVLNKIKNYAAIYRSYWLLYCKEHIQMTTYYRITNVETKTIK